MLRFLLLSILALFVVRAVWRLFEGIVQGALGSDRRPGDARGMRRGVKMARDPVCGTFVVPERAVTASHGGETCYFCSEKCRAEYAKRR